MDWVTELDKWTKDYLPDMRLAEEEPMAKHTSFRIGGPARRMAFPVRTEQLVLLASFARECGARPFLLGNGTNLLVSDNGVDRLVISTSELRRVEPGEDPGVLRAECGATLAQTADPGVLRAECGATLAQTADFACRQGLTGLEFAHGIPGSVGGAVYMNAGAYGGEMRQVTERVCILFPEEGVRTVPGGEMEFGYRRSLLADHPEAAVLWAEFRLSPGDPAAIRAAMQDLMARRKSSQPLEYPSAGSTFKRPPGHYAGTLIQQCGLKGLTVGGAQVSEKHGGFVINRGGATCRDVLELVRQVRERVLAETGVRLEMEVRVLGEDPGGTL